MKKQVIVIFLLFLADNTLSQNREGILLVKYDYALDRYGFTDSIGNEIIPTLYDYADRFIDGLALVQRNGFFGFINASGMEIIPVKYEMVSRFSYNLTMVKKQGLIGFLDYQGKVVIPIKYEDAEVLDHGLIKLQLNRKWGIVDSLGNIVAPFVYEQVQLRNASKGPLLLTEKANRIKAIDLTNVRVTDELKGSYRPLTWYNRNTGKFGFLDYKGKIVIPFIYDYAFDFMLQDDVTEVVLNGKQIVIDKKGNNVTGKREPIMRGVWGNVTDADRWNRYYSGLGLRRVERDNKWFVLDKNEKEINTNAYDYITYFSYSLIRVSSDRKYGLIDLTGKEVVVPEYDDLVDLKEGIIGGKKGSDYHLLDTAGKHISTGRYYYILPFIDGLAMVQRGHKYGFINKEGKEVVPVKYDEAELFYGRFTKVKLAGKYGMINRQGKESIPIKYDRIFSTPIYDEYKIVVIKGKYGVIDTTGKTILPVQFDEVDIDDLTPSMLLVREGSKWGIFNKNAVELLPVEYDTLYAHVRSNVYVGVKNGKNYIIDQVTFDHIEIPFKIVKFLSWSLFKVEDRGKLGLINVLGKVVVKPIYDDMKDYEEVIALKLKDKWGIANTKGKLIVPIQYDDIWMGVKDTIEVQKGIETFSIDMKGNRIF